MEYKLSPENDAKRKMCEDKISKYNKEIMELNKKIMALRKNTKRTVREKEAEILKLEIQIETIAQKIELTENSIRHFIYTNEMKNGLFKKYKEDKEISNSEYAKEKRVIEIIEKMLRELEAKKITESNIDILQMRIELERLNGASEEIDKLEKEIVAEDEYLQEEFKENLVEAKIRMYNEELKYKRQTKQITPEEDKQINSKMEETKRKGDIPSVEEIQKTFEQFAEKYLEKREKENIIYEKSRSSRSEHSEANYWNMINKQNINEEHKTRMARKTSEIPGLDYRIMKYTSMAPEGVDSYEYALKKIGETYYISEVEEEKDELAKQFGILEGKALSEYYNHWNEYGENEVREANGYKTTEPKRLLQFEKVNGLNIKETEETKGIDTTSLNQDIFVATYELTNSDDGFMKPIKEYYIKNKEGNFEKIGETAFEGYTTFNLDDEEIIIEDDCIIQGNTLEKVTQSELADKFLKCEIGGFFKEGIEVKEVLQITDEKFLKDFVKQIGHDDWDLADGRLFIVSTLDKKGIEKYDIMVRDNINRYKKLDGIDEATNATKEMYRPTGYKLPGNQGIEAERKTAQKEYITKDGHRYSITRDREGRLGFSEILKENENTIEVEDVDTINFFSKEGLNVAYKSKEINNRDIDKAYKTIERTKKEREQGKTQEEQNAEWGR